MEYMKKFTLPKVAVVAAALLATSTGIANAASPMPLTSQLRACDTTKLHWASATAYARMVADVTSSGSTVTAHVDAATAAPNAQYVVRVIQTPRASNGCAAGDPGVISGVLQTDAAGAGSVTLQGPIAAGKTGAWVAVDLPAEYSQTPTEFYTTEYAASI
jgi:hypothetical protein